MISQNGALELREGTPLSSLKVAGDVTFDNFTVREVLIIPRLA
jgi:hypothetical protein